MHTEEYLSSLVEKVKSAGAIGINFNKSSSSKELELLEILSYAHDNITTRNPDLLRELLQEYTKQ